MKDIEKFLKLIKNNDITDYDKNKVDKMIHTPCTKRGRISQWDYYVITTCTYFLSDFCKEEDKELLKKYNVTSADLAGIIYDMTEATAGYSGPVFDRNFGIIDTDLLQSEIREIEQNNKKRIIEAEKRAKARELITKVLDFIFTLVIFALGYVTCFLIR